ncbi:hypothetical protein RUND412_003920 [Rhizina undulata]
MTVTEEVTPGGRKAALINSILDLYHSLNSEPSLAPSPTVNALFSKLVALGVQNIDGDVAREILGHPEVRKILPRLRDICSEGEYALEMFWASRIVEGKTEEEGFLELNAVRTIFPNPQKILFIGSGPLPLSSLCMATMLDPACPASPKPTIQIHNIDISLPAIKTSTLLSQKLGPSAQSLTFENVDVNNLGDLSSFDVVFLAGLVGGSEQLKGSIIRGVAGKMRVGSVLALRSAHSLRRLLYQEIDVTNTDALLGLEILMVVHPYNCVVNSVVVTRVKGT